MPAPDADPAASALYEERAILAAAADAADQRQWRIATQIYGTLKIPALLKAVEAALKLADDWANTPQPEDGGDRAGVAAEQVILDGTQLRAAITAALTEGEGVNGH